MGYQEEKSCVLPEKTLKNKGFKMTKDEAEMSNCIYCWG